MPNLDWNAMLVELGKSGFHFPDLERFHFLISIYRAAGKFSAFSMNTLLDWTDFTARFSAMRILTRCPKEVYDVLEQSENLVLHATDFVQSSPLVREKAAYLVQQNLNSLDLCNAFYHMSTVTDEPQAVAFLRDEFRNNVELLTLAGILLPVILPQQSSLIVRNPGPEQRRRLSSVASSTFSGPKAPINSSSLEHTNSTPPW
jgi:hypothetical protein